MGDFFDDFPDDMEIDWSRISEERIQKFWDKLNKEDTERIFNELREVIDSNNQKKAVIGVSLKVLETLVKLGLKVI